MPIFDVMERILGWLYEECTRRIRFSIDSYLQYLTYEAPKPSLGSVVKYSMPDFKPFDLVWCDFDVEYLYEYFVNPMLSHENFYTLYYWFLWQVGSTVLISKDTKKLVIASEVLRTLIFPFTYDDTYIPVLPPNMIKYIEAPFPWHIGIMVSISFLNYPNSGLFRIMEKILMLKQ